MTETSHWNHEIPMNPRRADFSTGITEPGTIPSYDREDWQYFHSQGLVNTALQLQLGISRKALEAHTKPKRPSDGIIA